MHNKVVDKETILQREEQNLVNGGHTPLPVPKLFRLPRVAEWGGVNSGPNMTLGTKGDTKKLEMRWNHPSVFCSCSNIRTILGPLRKSHNPGVMRPRTRARRLMCCFKESNGMQHYLLYDKVTLTSEQYHRRTFEVMFHTNWIPRSCQQLQDQIVCCILLVQNL